MSATVFLMTDVVGSTALWEAHRGEMPVALALHDSIVHGAVAAAGGRVFKHTGDGMLAAFTDADAAAAAVQTAAAELAVADWGPTGPLWIRASLDAGTASERDGDFFGPPVNRVARINSITHPGQVVISQVARGLMRVPAGVELGEHQLRDLTEPVRLWQLDDGEYPPLTTLIRSRHSLPAMPTEFIGRRDEVSELRELLPRHQLVTIVGVGGGGKTRLAIETASACSDLFPGGMWFADLTPERDGAKVGDRAVAAMGLTQARTGVGTDPIEALRQATDGTATLLVLDNCEHVIDDAAELCAQILARAPSLTVLATSREALAIDGERAWRIPGLENAAVELFVARAEAAGATGLDDLDRIETVCEALDHIPLAIELAAAKLRTLSFADMADRLDDRFRLLDSGRRRGRSGDREKTLQAMMDWSYGLLDESQQLLLDELSVFSSSFALDGIEAVATPAPVTVLERLQSLVAQSLVTPAETEGRYRLLETVRLYGVAHLDQHETTETLRHRHLAWVLQIAGLERMLRLAVDDEWESNLDAQRQHIAEFENVVAAMEWAHETGDHDGLRSIFLGSFPLWFTANRHVGIGRQWLDRVGKPPPEHPSERAIWLSIAGLIYLSLGEFGAALRACDEGVELRAQQAQEDPDGVWWWGGPLAVWSRGNLHAGRGEYDQALALVRRLRDYGDRIPQDRQSRSYALALEADVMARLRDPGALATSRKSVAASRTVGLSETALALHASILLRAGLDEEALDAAQRCLDAPSISVIDRIPQIMTAAVAHARCGRFSDALAMVRFDLGPVVDAQRNHHRGVQLGALAFILAELGQPDRLGQLAQLALAVGFDSVASYHRLDYAELVGGEVALDAAPTPSPDQLSPAVLDTLIDELLAEAAELIDSR